VAYEKGETYLHSHYNQSVAVGITTGLNFAGLKSLACMYLCVVSVYALVFINFRDGMITAVHYSSAIYGKLGQIKALFF
jgi:hypothetical protein